MTKNQLKSSKTEIKLNKWSEEIYLQVRASDIYRTLSNILNNVIESIPSEQSGLIQISVSKKKACGHFYSG